MGSPLHDFRPSCDADYGQVPARVAAGRARVGELEEEIVTMFSHLDAGMYRVLCLVRELDRLQSWGEWGLSSCAHWLTWRCGIAPSAAREKVRVAWALEGVPKISEAFRKGEVSYSKVRAMTRVATAQNEEYLLQIARHGTAAHMERLVGAYRRVKASEENEQATARHRARNIQALYDEDGSLVVRARMTPEQGALFLKALDKAQHWLRERDYGAQTSEVDGASAASAEAPRAEVDGTTRSSGVRGACAENKVDRAGYREHRAFAEAPEALVDRQNFGHTRLDALLLMAETMLAGTPRARTGPERYQVMVHVDAEVLANDDRAGRCELEGGPYLGAETARRLSCDAALVAVGKNARGQPLTVGRKTRRLSAALRRALRIRDPHCQFPGCTRRCFLQGHHAKHWARGGETRLDNLVHLCHHHHHLVHEGGYGVYVAANGRFVFTRPDGRIIEVAPAPAPIPGEPGEAMQRANVAHGLTIDIHAENRRSQWDGEPMDYDMAIDALLRRDNVPSRYG